MKKILVVDDSPTMRRMVIASLGGLIEVGFEEASTGLEAIEQLAMGPIDLMILDLNMPDMHGIEVLQFMRKSKSHRHIPVIVLTTRIDDFSKAATLAAGATLYMMKSFEPRELAANALKLLKAE